MLRRYHPASYVHLVASNSETESNEATSIVVDGTRRSQESNEEVNSYAARTSVDRDALVEIARKYQKHMKKIAIPKARLTGAVVMNWQDFAKTLKTLYGQPLHYLTITLCKQWDDSSDDEGRPLGAIINWSKAEDTIWNVEEIHRLCTSPTHLAKLWLSDLEYMAFVDEVVP